MQLRRQEAGWRAAGGERPVHRMTNSIRPGMPDEPAYLGRSLTREAAVALRGSVRKRRRWDARWLEMEWSEGHACESGRPDCRARGCSCLRLKEPKSRATGRSQSAHSSDEAP